VRSPARRPAPGGSAIVAGEAGVGKTALVDAFAAAARMRGAVGRGRRPDGAWQPPYAPWREASRARRRRSRRGR
jgi:predicted ATPase